jgi:CheY-like chemotaxis protein
MNALKKILVVDDDPVVGRSFDRVLSKKGYAVITAADGEEALRKIAAEDYDVVYTDIRMPGMDGVEVAERIKGERPWLPVVIVTGYGSDDNLARAKAAGVRTVLHKPLSPEVIEASAHVALLDGASAAANAPAHAAAESPAQEPAPTGAPTVRPAEGTSLAKHIGLMLAAPFIGLFYVIALPVVGLAALLWLAGGALVQRRGRITAFVKNVALFAAAPFVGLAYVLAFPFVGLGMLTYWGVMALMNRNDTE